MSTVHELLAVVPQVGRVEWIGLAPRPQGPIHVVESATVQIGSGLDGDHHATSGQPSKRQVTLIQAEHLPVIAQLCGLERVDPRLLRRNIVVARMNLLSLKDRRFRVGDAILEWTGPCVPCSLMERNLGPGGFQAMRGHGGITAAVLRPGTISIGDSVEVVD